MKGRTRLTAGQREFFRLVRQAAGANPFTAERARLDREMAGAAAGAGSMVEHAIARVRDAVSELERMRAACITSHSGEDRELVRMLLLFHLYHEYRPQFDRHILDQMAAGHEPVRLAFAGECVARLRGYGFAADEIGRALAMFFQLRRAFYFIQTSLVGTSASMQSLRVQLWNNSFTHDFVIYERRLWDRMEDFATLLLGETGTGKGAAAAAIGRSGYIPFDAKSQRFAQSFTAIFIAANLSQYVESLIESELFGHRKGAFTGAVDEHQGIFGRCRPNGAIFLDEIGEVSIPVQIKLLRVIQERVYSPVGGHDEHRFAGRVIAATNRPLDALRREGRFRDDFYYRLCSDQIVVPPLRLRLKEAPEELRDLVEHILRRLCGEEGMDLADDVLRHLGEGVGPGYAWPGNVRELEQAVRRILLKGSYETQADARAPGASPGRLAADVEAGALDAHALLARYCQQLYERSGNYGEVARRTGLDRRTVRKYVAEQAGREA